MRSSRRILLLAGALALSAGVCIAQFRGGRRFWRDYGNTGPFIQTEGGQLVNEDTVRTARETAPHSTDIPNWTNPPAFADDVFTFTRVIFKSGPGRPPWWGWINDYPDSDLNLSFRLQQLTSLKSDPDCRVLKLTDPALAGFPMIHFAKPGLMELTDDEVLALRKYLLNGGAAMADDFWGADDWDNFEREMKRVFPERTWSDLPAGHPLFNCVFRLDPTGNKLQVPYIRAGLSSLNPNSANYGNSAQFGGEDSRDMHVRVWLDDKQRIMLIATHNTNNGDGWEREGEDTGYFHEYSENRAYPLAINIIFYLMTH